MSGAKVTHGQLVLGAAVVSGGLLPAAIPRGDDSFPAVGAGFALTLRTPR